MRAVVTAVCAAAGFCITSTVALAHMKLTRTAPEDGAALSQSPESVQVWYSQAPDAAAVSKLTLTGPGGGVPLRVRSGAENSLEGRIQHDGGRVASGHATVDGLAKPTLGRGAWSLDLAPMGRFGPRDISFRVVISFNR